MENSDQPIKYLQIGFPKSYAGEEFCNNIIPENSRANNNLSQNNFPDISKLNLQSSEDKTNSIDLNIRSNTYLDPKDKHSPKPQSFYSTTDLKSINPSSTFSGLSQEQNLYPNKSSTNLHTFSTPVNASNERFGYIDKNACDYQKQVVLNPYSVQQVSANPYSYNYAFSNKPTVSMDAKSHSKTHRSRGKNKGRSNYYNDEYSDNPSDYESDHDKRKLSDRLYSKSDYYDKDRDYIYYKTRDGKRYKHYR